MELGGEREALDEWGSQPKDQGSVMATAEQLRWRSHWLKYWRVDSWTPWKRVEGQMGSGRVQKWMLETSTSW